MKSINKPFLPDEAIIQNKQFVIYGNKEFSPFKETLISILNYEIKRILLFFKLDYINQITINLFSNKGAYQSFINNFSDSKEYSEATYYKYTINIYFEPNNLKKELGFLIEKILHQIAYIVYKETYEKKYPHVLWLDEGLASYVSGEYILLEKDAKKLEYWYLTNIVNKHKEIPNISYLNEYGNNYGEFVDSQTNKYDGYKFSYLLVLYLMTIKYPIDELIRDYDTIKDLETHIVSDCINYYNSLFHVSEIKQNFFDIKTPEELMDYMNLNINYGYLDEYGLIHNNLKDVRTTYRINTIEETLNSGLGTYIEQSKLIEYFFKNNNIPTKLFIHRTISENNIEIHSIVLFYYNDSWNYFEHTNANIRGIYNFGTLQHSKEKLYEIFGNNGCLIEVTDLSDYMPYKEFNTYIDELTNTNTHKL